MCASVSSRAEYHAPSRVEGWIGSIATGYEPRNFSFESFGNVIHRSSNLFQLLNISAHRLRSKCGVQHVKTGAAALDLQIFDVWLRGRRAGRIYIPPHPGVNVREPLLV
jgi:hypothetical protein